MTLKLAKFCDDPKRISTKSSYPQNDIYVQKYRSTPLGVIPIQKHSACCKVDHAQISITCPTHIVQTHILNLMALDPLVSEKMFEHATSLVERLMLQLSFKWDMFALNYHLLSKLCMRAGRDLARLHSYTGCLRLLWSSMR